MTEGIYDRLHKLELRILELERQLKLANADDEEMGSVELYMKNKINNRGIQL